MKENIITVIGSMNYDIIFKQSSFPQKGENVIADSVTFSSGGKGANQAAQCAKLGAKTYMVGSVGNDSFGEFLKDQLSLYGVNIENVNTTHLNTGLGVVNVISDGTLVATISTGANFTIDRRRIDELEYLLEKSKIVIMQLEIPIDVVEYAIEIASRHNCYIILNAAPAKEISDISLSKVNCLVLNEPEASFYTKERIFDENSAKENCESLLKKCKELVIITLGENGSLIYDGKKKTYIPPKKVNAIESTGAGDSYIGAFAVKMMESGDYIEAAKFATLAGAYTVTKIGAQSSMPVKGEI